jgi:hypothetical protein
MMDEKTLRVLIQAVSVKQMRIIGDLLLFVVMVCAISAPLHRGVLRIYRKSLN